MHNGETLNLLFRHREDDTFELRVKESWSGRVVRGSFVPPYSPRELNRIVKELNTLESDSRRLGEIGYRLFLALCGRNSLGNSSETPGRDGGVARPESSELSVQAVLRGAISRMLQRRGTVALTLSFEAGCEEFARYPWELLHNGEHFLVVSGIFTLTRVLLRPDEPIGSKLPLYPPFRLLYLSASPNSSSCEPLDTQRSYDALREAFAPLIEKGLVLVESLEQVTFDKLVDYLNTTGGANAFNDSETVIPCYAVHFDGHGAYGRLCPKCEELNKADAGKCVACAASLRGIKPQTYLSFCDGEGSNKYVDTLSLCELLVSTDVRLAVFSACETAALMEENVGHKQRHVPVEATLATALMMARLSAVVAMPFSLPDDLSPTFAFHFYKALAEGRTLEEAIARTRQAMLPEQYSSWFIPVLYRHVEKGQEGPVAFLGGREAPEEDHLLTHLRASTNFVGREQEVQNLAALLTSAIAGEDASFELQNSHRLKSGTHHLALTGPAGIGKSALACEAVRRNREKFAGSIIGISLQGGKTFSAALQEIAHSLHISAKAMQRASGDLISSAQLVLNTYHQLANRELPSLLLLDDFDEIAEPEEIARWHHFLCSLPEQVVVLATSRSNPAVSMPLLSSSIEGSSCRWYEYHVNKMTSADLLRLFTDLAAETGLGEQIHLEDPEQQSILHEICSLLDGYPLGAELIFGAARVIGGKVYTPEAASRSLEEVRDELLEKPLPGIGAVLEVAYSRLSRPAQLLLSYLAALKLPFSKQQIVMLVTPEASGYEVPRLEPEAGQEEVIPVELEKNWDTARDELVRASFLQFDGRVYTIHPQVQRFALLHLPQEERRRVHRVAAAYYSSLPQPSPEQWFAAFEHLTDAGDPQDLQKVVQLAVLAAKALRGRGHASELLSMLRKAEGYALHLGDKTGEGEIQRYLGAILRHLGQYAEAIGCLTRSFTLLRAQNERDEAGWALYELSMLLQEEGDFQQADQQAEEALTLFRETGDVEGEAWMQMVQGEISRGYGNYDEALEHFERALTSFRRLPNDMGYASTLRDRGIVSEVLGKYAEALSNYEEALRIFNTLGLLYWQAWVLTDSSLVYLDQGKLDLAEDTCRKALAIFHEQGGRRGEGWVLRVLGDIARKRHHLSDARGYYTEALALFNGLGDRVDQARVLNGLGAISFEEGELLEAQEQYEYALAIARKQGARQIEARALRGLGDVMRGLSDFANAERYYREAAEIAKALGTPAERCAVLHRQAALSSLRGQFREALGFLVQALALDRRLGHPERQVIQDKVDALVAEHSLKEAYAEFCKQYGSC